MTRYLYVLGFLLLLATPSQAQTATGPAETPILRFFAVPWLEGGSAWHRGRSNSYYRFEGSTSRRHLGGGLSVEMMPSPNVGIGIGVGVLGMGGEYAATYRVEEFFSSSTLTYRVARALDLTYLRTPLYVRFTPHLLGALRAYALAGVEPALLLGARADGSDLDPDGQAYLDEYSFIDGALLGGIGLEWWQGANTALVLGLRYRHGILGIQDERPPYPGGNNPAGLPLRSYQTPFDVTYPLRNRAITLEVAVKFGPTRRSSTAAPASPQLQSPPSLRTL